MIVYDSLTNSVTDSFRGVQNYITGVTASIVQGDPDFHDYLYIGGHIANNHHGNLLANLVIFRYDYETKVTIMNEIVYKGFDGCDSYDEWGAKLNENQITNYISHFGYMHDGKGMLFGVT